MEKKIRPDSTTRSYQYRLLIFGITSLCLGLFELPSIWTFQSDLIEQKGTLSSVDINIETVESRGHKSQKSELIFYLNEHRQKYYLVENIGLEYRNEAYSKILRGLKAADSIYVSIRKDEADIFEPEIFQIRTDRRTFLEFEKVQDSKSPLAAFLLGIGLLSIIIFLKFRFPDKFEQFLNKL